MTPTTTGASVDHTIGADGLVAISVSSGDVRLKAVDGEVVRIQDRDGRDLDPVFAIDRAEGSLAMRVGDRLGGRRQRHSVDLDVEVPRRATILIETASADVVAEGLLGDQRYRTTSGDITLRSVAGRIDIEVVSGDVDVIATGDADASLRTVSGDIELRAGTLRSMVIASTSGDVRIAGRLAGPGPFGVETVSGDGLLAQAGDLRVEMTTMSGDLQSDLDVQPQGGRGRRSLVVGSGEPLFTFRSMSGDLRVARPIAIPAPPAAESTAPAEDASIAGTTNAPAANGAIALAYDDARLRILRSVERGEIDVAEAGRRLEALDDGDPAEARPIDG